MNDSGVNIWPSNHVMGTFIADFDKTQYCGRKSRKHLQQAHLKPPQPPVLTRTKSAHLKPKPKLSTRLILITVTNFDRENHFKLLIKKILKSNTQSR
jgi:hypothetical protein